MGQLLRDREVGQMLGLSRSRVQQLALEGELPRVKIGRAARFRIEDVERLIEQSIVGPASETTGDGSR